MFKNISLGVSQTSGEKRDSLPARVAKMAEIVRNDPDSSYILWHDLEDERRAIQEALPEAVSIYGAQDLDVREQAIIDSAMANSSISALPVIAGSGCNFQRFCHKAIFVGLASSSTIFILKLYTASSASASASGGDPHHPFRSRARRVAHVDGQVATA